MTVKLNTYMATNAPTAPIVQPATNKPTKPDFGNGRFSAEMERLYGESQRLFKLTPEQAEKFARQAGSDAGAVLANATAEIRVGKASKDGKATISDASKVKGVHLTNALNIVRACQWASDAGKNGVSYGFTKWQLAEPLQAYVDSL